MAVSALGSSAQAWDSGAICAWREEPKHLRRPLRELPCTGQRPCPSVPWSRSIEPEEAREALRHAREELAAGRPGDALLQLRVVQKAMPRLADRVALMKADAFMAQEAYERALDAYQQATHSPVRSVAAQARVGQVRALLALDRPQAPGALDQLLRRYPHFPGALSLKLELARSRERRGQTRAAIALYRALDLHQPWTDEAAAARAALEGLQARGLWVRPLKPVERVERAERMIAYGTPEQGRQAVDALLSDDSLRGELRGRAYLSELRVARKEGDWERMQEAAQQARRHGIPAARVASMLPTSRGAAREAAREQGDADRQLALARIRALQRRRPIARLRNVQLRQVLQWALRGGLSEPADEAVRAMAKRRSLYPGARFDAALSAVGIASDEAVAELLETLFGVRRYRAAAHYHYARAMERLERWGEAEAHYLSARSRDHSRTGYYAMWANLRIWSMLSQQRMACLPELSPLQPDPSALADGGSDGSVPQPPQGAVGRDTPRSTDSRLAAGPAASPAGRPETDAAPGVLEGPEAPGVLLAARDQRFVARGEEHLDAVGAEQKGPVAVLDAPGPWRRLVGETPKQAKRARRSRAEALARLEGVIEKHGDAFPWLARARDLMLLHQDEAAAEELNEAFLAWRDAWGKPRLRSGLEALYRGAAPPRRWDGPRTVRKRRRLREPSREALAQVARVLGDPGVATRFAGWGHVSERPRAYRELVERVAREQDLDPNLLFAVMRVESVYDQRIVSTAGAVGLMQIMPRTGRLIARQLGVENFDTTDLLDPETNVRFAAWYLSSLIERFDGRLPLAIASYNGGPHNVRVWIRERGTAMPLDAFLEHIPFSQTHRYVRRVLTHYEAYRAQQGLPMRRLSTKLPALARDGVTF